MRTIDKKYKLTYKTLDRNDFINIINEYKTELMEVYKEFFEYLDKKESDESLINKLNEKIKILEKQSYEATQRSILNLTNICKENWIIDLKDNITINDNGLVVLQQENSESFIAYVDNSNSLNIKAKHFSENSKEDNNYKIIFKGSVTDSLKCYLLVLKYYEDGNVITEVVELNSSLIIKNDNLIKLSFILKLVGLGKFMLRKIDVLKEEKIYIKEVSDKYIKVQNFFHKINDNKNIGKEVKSHRVKVAVILDEFSYEVFKPEVEMINLNSKKWAEEIQGFNPEFLFVESTWRGNNNSWTNRIARVDESVSIEIIDLLKYCKEHNIPTVFWNKEGYINFEYFKNTSALFDYIFVTDENIIEKQKEACNHDRVYILPFAAQPSIHNSINKNANKLGKVAFAGTWYGYKHPTRIMDMDTILGPALNFDLDIYDRIFDFTIENIDEDLKWPDKFVNSIVGQLPYSTMGVVYKNYDVFLNVNSIKNSKYMMARRVYEILACKTPVISSYAESIDHELNGLVNICTTKCDTERTLKKLFSSPFLLERQGKLGQRYVLENHTYCNRIEAIFNVVGINYKKRQKPKVTTISFLYDLRKIDKVYDNLSRQTYESIEHLIIIEDVNINVKKVIRKLKKIENVKIITTTEIDFSELVSVIKHNTSGEYLAVINEDCYYGDNYIRDYVNTTLFTQADVIGKINYYEFIADENIIIKIINNELENCYCEKIHPKTIFFIRKLLDISVNIGESSNNFEYNILEIAMKNNNRIYSDDSYNFCIEESSGETINCDLQVVFFSSEYKKFINI